MPYAATLVDVYHILLLLRAYHTKWYQKEKDNIIQYHLCMESRLWHR